MAKGFGLLGLIIVVMSTQLPLGVNLLVGFIGLFFVTIGALGGDKMFSIAAVGTFVIALFFLSPFTLALVVGGSFGLNWLIDLPALATLTGVACFAAAPIVAMILHGTGKLVFGKPAPTDTVPAPRPPQPDETDRSA